MMAAPLALGGVEIEIIVKLISIPYVEMTLRLMERFGVKAEHSDSWDRFYTTGDPPPLVVCQGHTVKPQKPTANPR